MPSQKLAVPQKQGQCQCTLSDRVKVDDGVKVAFL
jgi:hypothetical protein